MRCRAAGHGALGKLVSGVLDGTVRPAPGERVREWLAAQAALQEGRLFFWSPIALTFGIWSYFALPREPGGWAVAAAGLAVAACLWLGRARPVLILVALVLGGLVLAKARAEWVATPVLHATSPEVLVTGSVLRVDATPGKRLAVLVAPEAIESLAPAGVPRRLRLSMTESQGPLRAGERVAFRARLAPLPSPVEPGGFDYGRKLWFEGIGGTGRVTARVEVLGDGAGPVHHLDRFLAGVRDSISARIKAHLGGVEASIAEALIVGERASIPKEVNQSLMISGLFHVLSISGLHMWMVAGGMFWIVRAALALLPSLALRFPIKKWAAAAALLTGWFYMLLADSGVATERSFLMMAVVFFAVLVDRPAVSTRNLAIAAIIVLVVHPEAAIDAGFQMSFLAVLGLVAFYEWWSARDADEYRSKHWPVRLARKTALAVFLALVTTAVASAMSSIPAAYHFGRLAPYGLIANGLAFPVIGIVIMPMALLSVLLMPFGLEGLPLLAMGEGLKLVLLISGWVAEFPGAKVIVAQPSQLACITMSFGAAAFCLIAGRLRFAGLAVVAAGLLLAAAEGPRADVLIERTGGNVAIRDGAGHLVPALARRARFSVDTWLRANGEEATMADAARRPGWTCTASRCDATVDGYKLAFVSGEETQAIACDGVAVLIASFPLRGRCKAVPTRIDRFDLWRSGSHAVFFGGEKPQVFTARAGQGERPWSLQPHARREVWGSR